MKIYLAGNMAGHRKSEVNDWRETFQLMMPSNVICASPFRDKEYLNSDRIIETETRDIKHPFNTSKGINRRDFNDVRTSNLIVACFLGSKEKSLGTAVEIGAATMANIPTIMIAEKGNAHAIHPMLEDCCVDIVETVEEAVFIARSYLCLPPYFIPKSQKTSETISKIEVGDIVEVPEKDSLGGYSFALVKEYLGESRLGRVREIHPWGWCVISNISNNEHAGRYFKNQLKLISKGEK